ncbi:MAG: hypothetical protein V4773_00100 [Verrucomicrobiota bacterium]
MLLSRFHVGLGLAFVVGIGASFTWKLRENSQLRAEATQHAHATSAHLAVLEKAVAAQTQRVAAAENEVTALLQAAKESGTASSSPPARKAEKESTFDADSAADAAVARGAGLIKQGKHQQALEEYLTIYRELQSIRPGSSECQRLMRAIKSLGHTYPPALVALDGLRAAAMTQLQAQPGHRELRFEVAHLNECLGEGHRTLALYDALPPEDAARRNLALIANDAFIEARRYSDVLLGRPFSYMLYFIESTPEQVAKTEIAVQPAFRKQVIAYTVVSIEVLTGAGRFEEARMITEKLLAFDNTPATQAALKKHVDRAQAPKP